MTLPGCFCLQTLINDLSCDIGEYCDDVISIKTAIMSFVNAALKYGAGQVCKNMCDDWWQTKSICSCILLS